MSIFGRLIKSKSIKSVSLFKKREKWAYTTVLPFAILYVLWLAWYFHDLSSIADTVVTAAAGEGASATNATLVGHVRGNVVKQFVFGLEQDLAYILLSVIVVVHALFILMTFWSKYLYSIFTCYRVKEISNAEYVFVEAQPHYGKSELCRLKYLSLKPQDGHKTSDIEFEFHKKRYIWNGDSKSFRKVSWEPSWTLQQFVDHPGLPDDTSLLLQKYGNNDLTVPLPTFMELFKTHAVAPFFVFQVFCVFLWTLDDYWYHSLFTLGMLVLFECMVVFQRIANLKELRGMAESFEKYLVKRGGAWKILPGKAILPGDLIDLSALTSSASGQEHEEGVPAPCDLLIIKGSCVVNEALLSGESTPLMKEAMDLSECADTHFPVKSLLKSEGKACVLFGGTKLLQSNDTCHGVVLRTGFSTSQGKLVRTMFYADDVVTANNLESFLFILFLLCFALIAAWYVWTQQLLLDPLQNRFALLVKCLLIITAVVPPELPMELSLAVNASLISLSKFAIFCIEPFRIPIAGKIDVCCFDKTGTLTDSKLVVQGLAGVNDAEPEAIVAVNSSGLQRSRRIIGVCHSLILLESNKAEPNMSKSSTTTTTTTTSVQGDPMEKVAFESSGYLMLKSESVKDEEGIVYSVVKRFAFNSTLRRMSVIAMSSRPLPENADEKNHRGFIACKGAPEVIECMLTSVPSWYTSAYTSLASSGARVLALGYRSLSDAELRQASHLTRCQVESQLIFAGFLVFHCPLKTDTKTVVDDLIVSGHNVIMITGDHSLTALHVAKELNLIEAGGYRILDLDHSGNLLLDNEICEAKDADLVKLDNNNFKLCITGEAFEHLCASSKYFSTHLCLRIVVAARFSPKHKESLLVLLKGLSLITLMCGDGTNDVGALKQAHIGVALLDGNPEDYHKIMEQQRKALLRRRKKQIEEFRKAWGQKLGSELPSKAAVEPSSMHDLGMMEDDMPPMISFGDASIAAPFTSKLSTISSVANIIRQGRCTLVTTIQMFKILALNSLITAYSLSVLSLAGVKHSDTQMTVTGFLLAFCFLYLSKSKPLQRLSSERPFTSVFHPALIVSILGQSLIHGLSLFLIQSLAIAFDPSYKASPIMASDLFASDESVEFIPTLLNSSVYLVSLMLQISTFVINYQGPPFRESLYENKGLRMALIGVTCVTWSCALELFPDVNQFLQMAPFPWQFKAYLVSIMAGDFAAAYGLDKLSLLIFKN